MSGRESIFKSGWTALSARAIAGANLAGESVADRTLSVTSLDGSVPNGT
jgi:hypothetical protein